MTKLNEVQKETEELQISDEYKGKNVISDVPAEYMAADIRLLDCDNPKPFYKSVDILNYAFGPEYLNKVYGGWQKGALDFTADGTAYTIWFPKLSESEDSHPSIGWINFFNEDRSVIFEKADGEKQDKVLITNTIRLIFSKYKNEPYYFNGVYIIDKEHSTKACRIYKRVARVADFRGKTPKISYYIENDNADTAIEETIKSDPLANAPVQFEYKGIPKKKNEPIIVGTHKVYCRNRQTAINALAHAGYKCEIDDSHPTFIRRNSDKPYTEPHHLIPMAYSDEYDVSLDVEENIVSLCSNCHNQIHYGKGAEKLLEKLYNERKEALKKVEIEITLEKLLSYYK